MNRYDIIINDWHQLFNYVIKKSIHMTMTISIIVMDPKAPLPPPPPSIRQWHICHDRNRLSISKNIYIRV